MGSILFAILAVGAQLDRNYIREKTLEGHQAAAAKGNSSRALHTAAGRGSSMRTCSPSPWRYATRACRCPTSPRS
ncbi:hypothetical protein [Microtetraspora glauca]|uniref:Resolvase/invertase-type recombinase catalytic domain-containing protein n=1 Tax=Microtetraspora glauca TaxID=1996 RepID=A0ABV3GKL0_MICGL